MNLLLLLSLATLVSEDLACITAGALVAQSQLSFTSASIACFLGIFFGDLLLYLAGSLAGPRVFRWRPLRRFLPPLEVERAAEWLDRRGPGLIFASRFAPGTRLPLYVAAGLVRSSFPRFCLFSAAACAVWTPVLVGLSLWLGAAVIEASIVGLSRLGVAFVLGGAVVCFMRPWDRRRRLLGWLRSKIRWEFWPMWAAYMPLIPWILLLAIRYRSLTLFTAANPGIYSGGLADESKSEILCGLVSSNAVPRWRLFPRATSLWARRDAVLRFIRDEGLTYPVVLKPDVGERGKDVAIIRSDEQLTVYLAHAAGDLIVQEYVPGLEFGVFYSRISSPMVTSIAQKQFPWVVGDGRNTLEHLILADDRAVAIASVYLARHPDAPFRIPDQGERVQLVEIGSHCRGAVFADARDLWTPELESRIREISESHPGFHFGRFDIRAASVSALMRGDFRVLELNGVAAEPIHIYDWKLRLLEVYVTLFRHWSAAFATGHANRAAGALPMAFGEFVDLLQRRALGLPRQEAPSGGEELTSFLPQ